jgi:hypothetical protein
VRSKGKLLDSKQETSRSAGTRGLQEHDRKRVQDGKRIEGLAMNEARVPQAHSFWEFTLWCLGKQAGARKGRAEQSFKKKSQTILSHSVLTDASLEDPEPLRRG